VSPGNIKVSYPYLADEDLMPLVADGDVEAFAALYDRHSSAAYSLARRLTGGREEAEDLAQDAFLKVWRSAGSYQPGRGSVRGWIHSVVRNQGIDLLRAQATRGRTQEKVEARAPLSQPCEAFAQTWRNSRWGKVYEALETLPHEQHEILALAHVSGLSYVEIARHLQLPLGTVKGRMRLGLKKLRNDSGLRRIATT
jgi:RNA polymerase sigma-70 factor (ECF subfamily)